MTLIPTLRASSLSMGLIALTIVIGSVYVDVQDTSPGRLSATHRQHPELVGSQNCEVCHGRPGQSMTSACLDCHQPIGAQIRSGQGFHGGMAQDQSTDCATCHSEHHGTDFNITNDRSFALAGIADQHGYAHEGLAFHLQGKHLSAACVQCHPNANVNVLPVGETRFLGAGQSCTQCHRDVHQGSYGQDCDSCHGQHQPFSAAANFLHTDAFRLVGAHANTSCEACHPANSSRSVSSLLSVSTTRDVSRDHVRGCRDCHDSPHDPDFVSSIVENLNISIDQSCQHCHPPEHGTFAGTPVMQGTNLHDATGFSLQIPHEQLSCETCHPGFGTPKVALAEFRSAFPGRLPDDCEACHRDPHQGQFRQGLFRGADCLTCHHRHTFSPSAFSIEHHSATHFPLRGQHARVECDQCHRLATGQNLELQQLAASQWDEGEKIDGGASGLVRIFHGTSTSCKSCHQDPHAGQFELGPFRGRDCDACHDEHAFRRPTFSLEQHAQTSFPLSGAHAAVACTQCHPRMEGSVGLVTDISNLPPRQFHGTSTRCGSCHQDVHQGRFDLPHLPKVIDGRDGCARCHNTESFQQIRAGHFDHGLWTGYQLRGAHRQAKCTACHSKGQATESLGPTFSHALGQNCQSCHHDPHVGQFGPTSSVTCTQCHVDGDSFAELVFDHQQHSKFPLDRDHQKLKCSACHRPQSLSDGRTAIRYKPLGTQCGDCHVATGPRSSSRRGG